MIIIIEVKVIFLKRMKNRIVFDCGEVDYNIIIDTVLIDISEVYELVKTASNKNS